MKDLSQANIAEILNKHACSEEHPLVERIKNSPKEDQATPDFPGQDEHSTAHSTTKNIKQVIQKFKTRRKERL